MTAPLSPSAIADAVMTNAPEVTATPTVTLPSVEEAPAPAQPALYDDAVAARHGRVAARSISMGFKHTVGEGLDTDTSQTLGDVLGELFGLASRHVNRLVYIAMLGLCVLPLIVAVVFQVMKKEPAE